jgi:hypothetical protein
MLIQTLFLAACCAGQVKIEPVHAQNSVLMSVLDHGLDAGGKPVIRLPPPRFMDGQTANEQRAALREIAGSDGATDELLRNSVTAPFIIKVHDAQATEATIRSADCWFVVYGDLKQIDPARDLAGTGQKEIEVANMWVQNRILTADEIRGAGIKPAEASSGSSVFYGHVHAKLLDRIEFEMTNRVVVSQSSESLVIASMTDPAIAKSETLASGWKLLNMPDSARQPYAGSISYAKISRSELKPGALLVEMHVAFVEPTAWFQGAPILRSKFSIVAQSQIRALRRELAKKRAK